MIGLNRLTRSATLVLLIASVGTATLYPPQLEAASHAAGRINQAGMKECCCGCTTGECCGTLCCRSTPEQQVPPVGPPPNVRRVDLAHATCPHSPLGGMPPGAARTVAASAIDRVLPILTLQSEWVRIQV